MRQKNLIFAFGTVLCFSLFGLVSGIEKQWTSLPYGGFEFSYKSKLPYGVFRFNFTASLNEEGNQDISAIISCSGKGDQWEADDPDDKEQYIKYVMCNPGDFITFRFYNDTNYYSHFVENTESKRDLGRDFDATSAVNIWLRLEELEPIEIGYGEGIPSAGFFRLVNNTYKDLQGFSYSNERTEFLNDPFNFITPINRDFQFKPTRFTFFAYMTPFTMPRNATFPTDFYLLQDSDNSIASWSPSRVKFLENGEVYPYVSYGSSYNPGMVCARVPTDEPYFLQFGEDFTPFVETELYSYYYNDSTICTINDQTDFEGDDIQFFLTRGETFNLGEEKTVNCSTGSVVPFTIRKKTSDEVVVATIRSSNGTSTAVGKRKLVVQDISKNDFTGSRICTINDVDVQTAIQLSVITVDIDSESTKTIEFEEGQELAVVKITTQSAAAFEWTSSLNPPFRFGSDGKPVPVECVDEYDCSTEVSAAFFFTESNPLYVQVFNPNVEVNNQTGTMFLEGSFESAFQLSGKPYQQNHLVFNSNTTLTQNYNEDEFYLFTVTIPDHAKCIYIYQNLEDAVLDFLPTSVNSDHSEDFYSLPSSDLICKKGNRDTVTWLSTIQFVDGNLTFQAPIFLGFEEDNLSYGETYTFNDNKTRVLILPPNDSDLVQFEVHYADAIMFGGASVANFEDEVVKLPKNQQPIFIKFGAANWMDQVTNMSISTHPFSILKYQYCETNNDCGGYPCRNQICGFPSTLTSTSSVSTSSSSTTTSPAVSTVLNEGDVAMSLKITFNGKLSNFNSTRFEQRIASVLDLSPSRVHVTNVSLASSSKRQILSVLKVSFTILEVTNSTVSAQSAAQNLFELVQNNDPKLSDAGIDVNGPLEIVTPFSFTATATSISQTKNAVVSFASKLGLSWIFVFIPLFYL